MSTLSFDSLLYARRLRAAGVPEQQAEVQAELMAEAFGFYATNIVTKDYLDEVLRSRLAEQDVRIEQRLGEFDARLQESLGGIRSALRLQTLLISGTWLLIGYPLLLDLVDRLA